MSSMICSWTLEALSCSFAIHESSGEHTSLIDNLSPHPQSEFMRLKRRLLCMGEALPSAPFLMSWCLFIERHS